MRSYNKKIGSPSGSRLPIELYITKDGLHIRKALDITKDANKSRTQEESNLNKIVKHYYRRYLYSESMQ